MTAMFLLARDLLNYGFRYNLLFAKELEKVNSFRNHSNDQLLEIQNLQFVNLFKKAINHSPFYKKLYADHGINEHSISSISDVNKLPIITKQDIRNRIEDIYLGGPLKTKGYTSGTSGSPLKVYRSYQSVLREAAYIWSHRATFGYKPRMKTVSLRGDLGREKMEYYDKVSNTLYLSSYHIREDTAKWYHRKIEEFTPYAILAYPSSVANLANAMAAINRDLHVPLVFTSSETLYNNQREKVEKIFGAKIYDWYGNAERTIAIEQREDGKYYELPTYSYNEYYDDRTVCSGFLDSSFPLIRYEVTDVIKPASKVSGQNDRRFEISEISGRNDDNLVLPDGTKVGRLDFVFKGINHIEYAQFVQTNSQEFVLNLVVSDGFTAEDEANIIKNMERRIGKSMEYDIRKVTKEDIIVSSSNKFKLVISEL